jgi:hypothetical protein
MIRVDRSRLEANTAEGRVAARQTRVAMLLAVEPRTA